MIRRWHPNHIRHNKNSPTCHQWHIYQIHNIKLNPIYENNMCTNVLDLTTGKQTNLEIDIYHKPTTTDTTINFLSNHPIEHKMAAFRYHISRMYSLPLAPEKKQKEWELIQIIARKKQLPTKSSTEIKLTNTTQNQPCSHRRKRWHKNLKTFTYYTPQIRKITNLFKHTNIGIAFRNTNTLHQLTKPKILNQTPEHNKSGVYKLTHNTCQIIHKTNKLQSKN